MAVPSLVLEPPDDLMQIRNEIRTFLVEEVRKEVEKLKPQGFRLFLYCVRHIGGAVGVIAIFACVISLTTTFGIEAFHRGQSQARFQQQTTDRLAEIESQILALEAAQNPSAALKKIEKLPATALAQSLSALRAVVAQPVEDVKPDRAELSALGARLAEIDSSSPEYWPTVLAFIRFASNGMANNAPPPGKPNLTLTNDAFIGVGELTNPGLRIVLDGGELRNVTVTGDRIIFTNRPVRLINVRFIDCAFEFPKDAISNEFLRKAASQILPSIASAVVNLGNPAS